MIRVGTVSGFVGVASEAWNHPTGSSQPVPLVRACSYRALIEHEDDFRGRFVECKWCGNRCEKTARHGPFHLH